MSFSPAEVTCPSCGQAARTPLCCEACGTLFEPERTPTPFEILDIAPTFELDPAALRRRMLELTRHLHPDFHGSASPEARRLAEANTAAVNSAFHTLSDEFRRADWLVCFLGGPGEDEERSLPAPFLADVLEWNESIEAARTAPPGTSARHALGPLSEELTRMRSACMHDLARLLVPLPRPRAASLVEVRQRLNALRYVDRALTEIRRLRTLGST